MSKLLCVLSLVLVSLCGCSKPSPDQIVAIIDASVPIATQGILMQAAKKDAAKAAFAAKTISTVCQNDAIPFVQNNSLPASVLINELQTLISAKIDSGFESGVAAILASIFANTNINAPKMSANEQRYVLAGLTSLKAGCDLFLQGKTARLYEPPVQREVAAETQSWGELLPPPRDAVPQPEVTKIAKPAVVVPVVFTSPAPRCSNGSCWVEYGTHNPINLLPEAYPVQTTCRNGQCHRSDKSCQAVYSARHWDSDADGHGQGGWVGN